MKTADVRSARTRDAARVAELATQLGYPVTTEEMRSRLGVLQQDGQHSVLVAQDATNDVLGWIHVGRRHGLLSEPDAEIFALVVDERERGKGIGSELVRAAENWARGHGCATLRVRSNVVREQTHRFYRRLAYEASKRQEVFDKRL